MPAEFAYYMVAPESSADRPKIVAFREWMKEEIKIALEARGA
jgi:DNA-binding transcriptional LysR family regulator